MSSRLRRFLHLERARPTRPEEPSADAAVDARFDAVLRGVAAGDADEGGPTGEPDALPVLRWLRRRWW